MCGARLLAPTIAPRIPEPPLALPDQAFSESDNGLAHIKMLRAKLRAVRSDEDPIRTHRGLGYSMKESA